MAADPSTVGIAYVTGVTFATNFPVAGVPYDATANGRSDRFVSKFDTTSETGAQSLVWSTFLGGSRFDDADSALGTANPSTSARGLAVDTGGAVYIAGQTVSTDFPTAGTVPAHDTTCGTDGACNATNETFADGVSSLGSATFTSATAGFISIADVGRTITGTNILAGTTIAAVTNPTTITLSQNATGSGTNPFTVQGRGPNPDAFVAKLSSSGSTLVYGSYLGGGRGEAARGIAVSGTTAFVVGDTRSADLTTTATPLDATCGSDATCDATDVTNSDSPDGVSTSGSTTYTSATASFASTDVGKTITGTNIQSNTTIAAVSNHRTITLSQPATASGTNLTYIVVDKNPVQDAFVATVNTTSGALAYSTYLGGARTDAAHGVAVDGSGRAHVVGNTISSDFPMAGTPFDNSLNGNDAFVARLDPAVSGAGALSYSTFLGGTADDEATAVAVDAGGKTHATGSTSSTDFPTSAGAIDPTANGQKDAFVAKLDTDATSGAASRVYSTYLGSSFEDAGSGIAVTGSPSTATVVGLAGSSDFPSLRPLSLTGSGFIANLNSTGISLVYSTRFPASINAVALDSSGNPYLTGYTGAGLPVTATTAYQPAKQSTGSAVDAFLTRIDPVNDAPLVTGSTPKGGPPNGGTPVTITGSLTGTTAVNFGSVAVTTTPCPASPTSAGCFTQDSATQITAVSPACAGYPAPCASATVNITVTNAQGTSATTGSATFSYGEGLFNATTGAGPRGVLLHNGKILQPAANPTPSKLYDPVTGTTADTGTCPATCHFSGDPGAVVLTDGRVLMAGGLVPCTQCNRTASATAHLYDPATGLWSQTGSMTTARYIPTTTVLTVNCGTNCGKVLMVGGCSEDCTNLGEAGVTNTGELYNPATGTWAAVTNTTGTALFRNHTATLLDGPACTVASPPTYCGKVLVAGGYVSDLNFTGINDARLYDPVGNDFEATGNNPSGAALTRARGGHTASLLNGPDCTDGSAPAWCGKVLIAGGYAQGGSGIVEPTSELYDPAASAGARFGTTGTMTTPRGNHFAAQLPNGKVLVAGGATRAAELYEPGAGTWSSAGAMSDIVSSPIVLGRSGAASVACHPHCGKVLFAGGSVGQLYTPLPVVTSIDRASDCAAGGAAITITGTGLSAVTKASFGSNNATRLIPDTANPDTRLIAVTPPGSGPANLTLTSPAGISAATTFTYQALTTPCAPQSPVGTAHNGGAIVTWTAPTTGLAPTGYTVRANAPLESFNDGVVPAANSTTLFSATATFRTSVVGKTITVSTFPATTIAAVPDATKATLVAPQPAAVTGAAFTINRLGATAPAPVNVGSATLSTTISGLTNGVGYTFTVTPTNASGSGSPTRTSVLVPGGDDLQPPVNPAFYNSNDQAIRGTGSDTTFALMNDLGRAFQETPGCVHNTPTMPNNTAVVEGNCATTQPGGVITTENYDHETHFGWYPTGSGNGIRQLCKQTLPKPANVPPVNYARSSSSAAVTKASDCQPAAGTTLRMKFVAYAKDAVAWVNWSGGGGSGLTNLTKAQLQGIFTTCTITNWNQVGGANAPIVVYTPRDGSGTRASWDFYLGGNSEACIPTGAKDGDLFTRTSTDSSGYVAGDTVIHDATAAAKDLNAFVVSPNFASGTTVTSVAAGVSYTVSSGATAPGSTLSLNDPEREVVQNTCMPAQSGLYEVDAAAANEGNAIAPYSFGAHANKGPAETCTPRSIDGVAPSETTIANGSFGTTRFVYNVYRDSDNGLGTQPAPIVAPFALALVGDTGWICKPGANHSQPPDATPGNGVESSNVTTDYGLLVWDTIRNSGFFPLTARTDAAANRCLTETKDFVG